MTPPILVEVDFVGENKTQHWKHRDVLPVGTHGAEGTLVWAGH